MKIDELNVDQLNWVVAKAVGYKVGIWEQDPRAAVCLLPNGDVKFIKGGDVIDWAQNGIFHPATSWETAGPLIQEESISVVAKDGGSEWWAAHGEISDEETLGYSGPTALIAAMRCFVASKLGEDIDSLPALLDEPPAKKMRP